MTENTGRVWGQDRAELWGGEECLEHGYSILRRESLKGTRKMLWGCEIARIYPIEVNAVWLPDPPPLVMAAADFACCDCEAKETLNGDDFASTAGDEPRNRKTREAYFLRNSC